jgi:protease-4
VSARRALALVLLIFGLACLALVMAIGFGRRSPSPFAHAVLVFEVPSELPESQAPRWGFPFGRLRDRPTVWDVVRAIRHAAEDDRIEALVLHVDGVDWGWAKVAEVREAVLAFRATGKPVYASMESGGEKEYLLATAASRVTAPPLAVLQLDGLAASALYLRGTFDKLDVRPNFAHVGQYKSAVEGYTRTDMSPPAREALQSLLDDEYAVLVDSLASARGIAPDSVTALLDNGPYVAGEALAAGLVDSLLHPADLDTMVVRMGDDRRAETLWRYLDRLPPTGAGTHVALIAVEGEILPGQSRENPMGGRVLGEETVIAALRDAASRPGIKGIVLRIDSPGGSADASDRIWREVMRARKRKPMVVSMSDLAASGGYYVAAGADSIVAHPGTITGSIGVFGGKLNVLGLYRKMGLNVETVTRGPRAEMLSPFRDFTPEEHERFQRQMEAVYHTFVSRVTESRDMDAAWVDSIGQGRVWSGRQARERGLVDGLGGLERAFAMVRAKAGLEPDEPLAVEVYPRVERTLLQRMVGDLFEEADEVRLLDDLRANAGWRAWSEAALWPTGVALALMPYRLEIR